MALKGYTSDLERFVYAGKPVLPERDSYQVTLQGGVVSSSVAGGLAKQQVQFTNSPYSVSVNYKGLDEAKTIWMSNFINRHRGKPFIATLLIGGTELDEFVVRIMGNPSLKTTGFNGSIKLTLQVEPAVDHCFINWAHEAYMCLSAQDWCKVFNYTKQGIESWPSYPNTPTGNILIPLASDLSIYEEFVA